MTNIWVVGLEIRFYSAWIGIPILLCLLYPTTKQLLKRKKLCKSQSQTAIPSKQKSEYKSQSTSTSYTYTDDEATTIHKYAPFILSFYAFSNVIFALIHLLFVAFLFGIHFNITLNDSLCNFAYVTLYQSYNLSSYFYFMFMLYRIRIVFRQPESLRLHKKQYFLFLIFIHLLFVLKIILSCFSTFVWNKELNFCTFIIDPTILSIFFYVKYCGDSVVIILLSFMFIKRLFALTSQNENVNNLIKRTILFGLLACVTSLFISIGKLCGLPTEYFVNIDEALNCFCVVFSYKVECPCTYAKHFIYRITTTNNNNDGEDIDGSSSETYIQPPDDVVLEEIFGGDRYESENHDIYSTDKSVSVHVAK